MNRVVYPLEDHDYIKVETAKKKIVLHGSYSQTTNTSGRDTSIIDSWNQRPTKVGTSYVIGRDGTVYDVFPDKYWAFHLNLKDTGALDKESIGITLAWEGPLFPKGTTEDPKKLNFYAFDSVSNDGLYTGEFYNREWRGESYWAELDDKQLVALAELVTQICQAHNINPLFHRDSCVYDRSVWEKSTILCHSNISLPALDFPINRKLIQALMTAGIPVV